MHCEQAWGANIKADAVFMDGQARIEFGTLYNIPHPRAMLRSVSATHMQCMESAKLSACAQTCTLSCTTQCFCHVLVNAQTKK